MSVHGFLCSRCKKRKAAEEFYPSRRGEGNWCRDCCKAYKRTEHQKSKRRGDR